MKIIPFIAIVATIELVFAAAVGIPKAVFLICAFLILMLIVFAASCAYREAEEKKEMELDDPTEDSFFAGDHLEVDSRGELTDGIGF